MSHPSQQIMSRGYLSRVVLNGLPKQMCHGITQIDFGPGINVLAGPNGSGKSTILRVVRDRDWRDENGCEVWKEGVNGSTNVEWVAFDAEQDNPRYKAGRGPFQFTNTIGSHGEANRKVYKFLTDRIEPGMCVLLDEPEAALDTGGVRYMLQLILGRQDVQWIMASHHTLVWQVAMRQQGARVVNLVPDYIEQMLQAERQMLSGVLGPVDSGT